MGLAKEIFSPSLFVAFAQLGVAFLFELGAIIFPFRRRAARRPLAASQGGGLPGAADRVR
jgi:hypothetical protein